ncbi:MAG: hypothetical protein ACR2FO_03005 [Actinomycetota bacterium]
MLTLGNGGGFTAGPPAAVDTNYEAAAEKLKNSWPVAILVLAAMLAIRPVVAVLKKSSAR